MHASHHSRQWTATQRSAIETCDRSLLLSAAAGSGKTAVLAEHCAYLVCDATEPYRCGVEELVVVTFTNAAAAEMRSRIEKALRRRLSERDNARLIRQIMLLDSAQICTLHSFCTTVLRRHFNLVGLDPSFTMLDDEESRLLLIETARQVIADRFETDRSDAFRKLIDLWADGNDERILKCVVRAHNMLCSVVDPDRWMNHAIGRLREASASPLHESELGHELGVLIEARLSDYIRRCADLSRQFAAVSGLMPYAEFVNELIAIVDDIRETFAGRHFDALSGKIRGLVQPELPRVPGAIPEKETAKKRLDALRKELQHGAVCEVARFTEQEWCDGLKGLVPAAEVFVDLIREFGDRYRDAKRETGSLDFSDLERLTLQVLRAADPDGKLTPSPTARAYHRQFRHVLVDEYQDINEVQDAILRLISRECVLGDNDAPQNLFCVGDVKQSIYRFRLADPRRFLERNDRFRRGPGAAAGTVIDLQQNFRSRAPLLAALNHVFERLMTAEAAEIHYDASQRLHPGASFPEAKRLACFTGSPIELHLLPKEVGVSDREDGLQVDLDRTQREAAFVAHRIRQLMGEIGRERMHVLDKSVEPSILRPLQHRDIAILLRAMRHKATRFADMLRPLGIAVHSDAGSGFFDSMEIRDMLALLALLDNLQQDIPLAAVLRGPMLGLAEAADAMARVRMTFPGSAEDPVPFHRATVRYAAERNDELAAQLRGVLAQLRDWRDLAHRRPLAELLWTIYDRTGYLAFCAGLPDGEQRVANLIHLHERARQFGSFQRQGLRRFIQFLQTLQDQEHDIGQPPVASEADDAVRVMSIHRAKGLEFPVVIVADLGKQHNMSDIQSPILMDRQSGLGMSCADEARRIRYPSVASVLLEERIHRQSLAEELRVLYVAMTRAREHLILVGTCDPALPVEWKQRWGGHEGPLPPQEVLRGRSMLDWIGPVAGATDQLADKPIDITMHDEAELRSWSVRLQGSAELSESQRKLALLEPLPGSPAANSVADEVRQRLLHQYPYQPFTELTAVRSVGSLAKTDPPVMRGSGTTRVAASQFLDELPVPRCVQDLPSASAFEQGSVMHLLLQHLDFERAASIDDIRGQVQEMVARRLIAERQAESLDVEAIRWLMTTAPGKLLRANAGALRRELPVHFPHPDGPSSADPLDQIMVRGRIDVLIPDREGLVVLDYKTDRVTSETIDQRTEFYRDQANAYSHAIGRIVGEPVKAVYLVFLTAREIRTVSPPRQVAPA